MGSWGGELKRRAYRMLPLRTCQRLMPREVIGLHYHVVSERSLPHVRHLYRYKTPAQFESDLVYLKAHFRLLSYEQLLAGRDAGHGDNARPAAILTFDDGYRECFSVVRPLLLKHQVPCIFFLVTGFLDNQHLFYRNKASLCIAKAEELPAAEVQGRLGDLGWSAGVEIRGAGTLARWLLSLDHADPALDRACALLDIDAREFLETARPYLMSAEVRTLAADGFTIGAHSKTHPVLGRLPARREVEEEIVDSSRIIHEMIGSEDVPFAFPVTDEGVDRTFLEELRSRHPFLGLIFGTGRLRRDREFIVHRVPVERPAGMRVGRSNIPDHLRRAYVNQGLRNVREAVHSALRPADAFPVRHTNT